ncbi:uncharacterized protein [Apostichopus japonicus]|uniref:uncharacterized protein isoform X2 n=1 Tax=Stichopus japonicus TaxID=307972 RepID=UPI003AB3A4F1
MSVGESAIVAIGNPLLDISATATLDFLKKYDLEDNISILAEEKHVPMFKDMVDNLKVDYIPGGATQNTIRMAQWILGEPKRCAFFGSIGNDKYGTILKNKMLEFGAHVNYLVNEDIPTGTCACVLTGNNRSLVANLAAANHYKKDHLLQPENWAHVELAKLIYVAGFHLTVATDAMLALGKHAAEKNKIFSINLSAPFLCQFFKEQQMSVMPYVDYLFGNETEFACYAKEQNMGTEDLKEIALKAAAFPKENSKRERVVVITQGDLPTIVAKGGKVTEYPIRAVKKEDIVDTNGAGDCYVGGFISQLIQDKSIEECIKVANYCASYIIQTSGITMEGKPNFE